MNIKPIVIVLLMCGTMSKAQDFSIEGLWKVIENVFDGSVNRLDNQYLEISGDTVIFYCSDSISAEGILKNDTIYMSYGFDRYDFDWINIINKDSLVSSPANLEVTDNLTFTRIDLSGLWEQISYSWDGSIYRDTCEITQVRDTVSFHSSSECFARAYLKKDSIIVLQGFEGIGIDYFTMYSNDYFMKTAPLVEAIDKIEFIRIKTILGRAGSQKENNGIQIFPLPCQDYIRINSEISVIQELRLFTHTGKLVKFQPVYSNACEINLSGISSGLFFIEIAFKNERTGKIIVKN